MLDTISFTGQSSTALSNRLTYALSDHGMLSATSRGGSVVRSLSRAGCMPLASSALTWRRMAATDRETALLLATEHAQTQEKI